MAPITPGKRVTRARAAAKKNDVVEAPLRKAAESRVTKNTSTRKTKAVEEESTEEPAPVKRTTSRATTKPAPLAVAPRRRVKVTPLTAPAAKEEAVPEPVVESAVSRKPSTRSKKVADAHTDDNPTTTATKPRTRAVKSIKPDSETNDTVLPKTRGRSKKLQDEPSKIEADNSKPTRQTRARSNSNADVIGPTPVTTTKPATGARKKVTFQDVPEDDKENQPIPTKRGASKKEATPATGMRAKPVRKPINAPTKKTAATTKKDQKPAPRALTPKKITQVSQLSAAEESDEEDILNGGKTPIRDLSQSPKRNPALAAQLSPVKKLDFAQQIFNKSPEQRAVSPILESPARRPPSPVKDTLQQSPRRGDLTTVFSYRSQPSAVPSTLLAPSVKSQSVLLQSPKRAPIDASIFSNSAIKPFKSPLKASLLMSPAKRLFSPAKRTPLGLKKQTESTTPFADNKPGAGDTLEDITVSSHFRASTSPQRSAKIHRMSEKELADELSNDMDFDDSILNIRSPFKVAQEKRLSATEQRLMEQESADGDTDQVEELQSASGDVEMHQAEPRELNQDDEVVSEKETEEVQTVYDHKASTMLVSDDIESQSEEMKSTGEGMTSEKKPRLSEILFRTTRAKDDESSSEDELAADQTPDRAISSFRSSLTNVNTRSRLSTAARTPHAVGYTPLAVQMSGWFAASPEKQQIAKPEGTFSPLAAQHVPGEVQISRQSTPQQRKSISGRQSTGARRSLIARASLTPSMVESPEKTSYFADQMAAQEVEEQIEDGEDVDDLHALVAANEAEKATTEEDAGSTADNSSSEDGDTVLVTEANGELTTDLINFTNASDTALVDFAQLAQEADELASHTGEVQSSSESVYGDENVMPVSESNQKTTAAENMNDVAFDQVVLVHQRDVLAEEELEKPTDTPINIAETVLKPSAPGLNTIPHDDLFSPSALAKSIELATPARPDYGLPRFVNTIVSKVPLKPEGDISPIKVQKKRSLSFTVEEPGSAKRLNFSPGAAYGIRSVSENVLSPERRIRSAAPSPAHTTPGQMSFAVDDFGDSTLDGIELPDDMDFDVTETPATVKSYKNIATPSRTPLKAVGGGVLHGAVVYVDVHTTEGADASSIFIDLLTQMGARCVKEWKWNPRASLGENSKPGVTHVVYKDGGKRTLEKVRDTKGEVWCVGVGWVLDCERENKWLDEASYAVDHSVIPRGGSRRRKSMEPRMLVNENGSLSAKSGRRSVSGEMTNAMKEELINTPVRTHVSRSSLESEEGDTTEISSTYNSPTTHMNVGISTPTALINWDPATAMTPAPMDTPYLMKEGSKLVQMTCPPKQTNKGIFDGGERANEKKEEKLKLKLAEARRKTMGWRPRIGSPLGKI